MKNHRSHVTAIMIIDWAVAPLPLFHRAIDSFIEQTHSHKDFIIVYRGSNKELLKKTKDKFKIAGLCLTLVKCKKNLTLGEMRNLGLDHAKGPSICMWDSDDTYSRLRIQKQLEQLQKNPKLGGVCLKNFIYELPNENVSIPCHWPKNSFCSGHPSTLLFKKSRLRYLPINKGEDVDFFLRLKGTSAIKAISTRVPLYQYTFHGANVSGALHHFQLLKASMAKSPYSLLDILRRGFWSSIEKSKLVRSPETYTHFEAIGSGKVVHLQTRNIYPLVGIIFEIWILLKNKPFCITGLRIRRNLVDKGYSVEEIQKAFLFLISCQLMTSTEV